MRTTLLTLTVLVFLAAPRLSATEVNNEPFAPSVTPTAVSQAAQATELRLTEVQIRDARGADDAAVAQFPQRGSFWWVVGAIVVGGVILAVLL